MKIRTEQRQFRSTTQSGQHVVAMQPEAFGFMFFGGYEDNRITDDGIAVVSICGPLEHHAGWFDSYDAITDRVEAALASEDVRAVVLCFDSPGGDASGVEEAHRKLKTLRRVYDKPIFAYSNESCYSAAYWLACAADEIWLPPTGGVGSVGVIAAAIDCTAANTKAGVRVELVTTGARKADGHPDRPLTDDVLGVLQERVDQIGGIFFASVAESRETSPKKIVALQAGCFLGQSAIGASLADGVAGWDDFLGTVQAVLGVDAPVVQPVGTGGTTPTSGSAFRSDAMKKKLLCLTKAQTTARAALEAAKTPEERKAALKAFEEASENLAKVKYSKRTRTDELEEDDGEESEEESDDDEDEEEDDDPPPSKKKDDDDDEAEEEEEEEDSKMEDEEERKALKSLAAKGGAAKAVSLYRAVAALTGKKNLSEQLGALSAFESRIRNTAKLEQRMAKIESERQRDKVDAMLNKASAEGRVSPGMRKSLRAQGIKDPDWLKGHLTSLPKRVHTVEDGARPAANTDGSPVGAPKFDLATMSKDERQIFEQSAAATGLTLEKTIEQANKVATQMNPGAPRH